MFYRILTKSAIIVLCIVAITANSDAQINRLMRATTNKLANELERMAIEKISDVIAQKAAERIEREFDKMLQQAMKDDSTKYNRDSAYYALGSSYAAFVQGLNDAADLPESYVFDLNVLVDVKSGNNGKAESMRYYYSTSDAIIGVQTAKSETNWQFLIMDLTNDVTVMYQHDGDKKTAQALPNMMKLAAGLSGSNIEEKQEYRVTPLKGKQRIAGYKCDGFEGTNGDVKFEAWLTDALDVNMKETYSKMVQQFGSSDAYLSAWEDMSGMVLKSEAYNEKGELISSMLAKEVGKRTFTIKNADYTFGNQ
jgi:Domain of unknown function (DUF4412)